MPSDMLVDLIDQQLIELRQEIDALEAARHALKPRPGRPRRSYAKQP